MGKGPRRFRQADGIEAHEVDGSLFLVDQELGTIHHLDGLAGAIWRLLESPRTLREVVAALGEAFPDQEPARINRDARRFIRELSDAALLADDLSSERGKATPNAVDA